MTTINLTDPPEKSIIRLLQGIDNNTASIMNSNDEIVNLLRQLLRKS